MRLAEWIYAKLGKQHAIALDRLAQLLFDFLTTECSHTPSEVSQIMHRDLTRSTHRDAPEFLRPHRPQDGRRPPRPEQPAFPARQRRHLT
jgi:hypothetical protein